MPRSSRLHAATGSAPTSSRPTGYEPRPEAAPARVSLEVKAVGAVIGLALLTFVIFELASSL